MTKATAEPRPCQVRNETHLPCSLPATTTILGVSFCERYAREQERYLAVGELTQASKGGGAGCVEA